MIGIFFLRGVAAVRWLGIWQITCREGHRFVPVDVLLFQQEALSYLILVICPRSSQFFFCQVKTVKGLGVVKKRLYEGTLGRQHQ